MAYVYGNVSHYSPKVLTADLLTKYRTGLHAGNPAELVLLVREIDRLHARVDMATATFRAIVSTPWWRRVLALIFPGRLISKAVEAALNVVIEQTYKDNK